MVASVWRRPAGAPDPAGRRARVPQRAARPRPREQPGRATLRPAAPSPRTVAAPLAPPDPERRLPGSGLQRGSAPGECAGRAGARRARGEAARGSPGQCRSSAGGPGSPAGLEPDSLTTVLWG